MKRSFEISLVIIVILLLNSCTTKESSGLREIFVDVDQNSFLNLSEISDEIKSIELELTDSSLIKKILKVLVCDEYIIALERKKILKFDHNGKFIKQIGSVGQGPGEFLNIIDIAADTENNSLYIACTGKIINLDFEGNLIKEYSEDMADLGMLKHLNFANDELIIMSEHFNESINDKRCNRAMIYKLNRDLQLKDSIGVRTVCLDNPGFWFNPYIDYITYTNKDTYFYFPEMNIEPFVRDTLYMLENNQLVPQLRLKFKNEGVATDGMKFVYLFNIYQASRFIFAVYTDTRDGKQDIHQFCYDTKLQKGYDMKDGFVDDIHNVEERVKIRPLNSDVEMFYYLHTNMNDVSDNGEEPNPTLYIGKLKK